MRGTLISVVLLSVAAVLNAKAIQDETVPEVQKVPESEDLKTEGRMMSSMMARIRGLANKVGGGNRRSPYNTNFRSNPYIRTIEASKPKGAHLGPAKDVPFTTVAEIDFTDLEHPLWAPKKRLSLYDYRDLWLAMLYDVHKLMSDKTILESEKFSTKVLKKLFNILQHITIFEKPDFKKGCPYGFDVADDMCVTSDPVDEAGDGTSDSITWDEARTHCLLKGGDLFIAQNANQLNSLWNYINYEADPGHTYDYFVGATDLGAIGDDVYWLDGTKYPISPVFTGVAINHPTDDQWSDSSLDGTAVSVGVYVKLNSSVQYQLDILPDGNMAGGYAGYAPICQYIAGRDGHLDQGIRPTGTGPIAASNTGVKQALAKISANILAEKSPSGGIGDDPKFSLTNVFGFKPEIK